MIWRQHCLSIIVQDTDINSVDSHARPSWSGPTRLPVDVGPGAQRRYQVAATISLLPKGAYIDILWNFPLRIQPKKLPVAR